MSVAFFKKIAFNPMGICPRNLLERPARPGYGILLKRFPKGWRLDALFQSAGSSASRSRKDFFARVPFRLTRLGRANPPFQSMANVVFEPQILSYSNLCGETEETKKPMLREKERAECLNNDIFRSPSQSFSLIISGEFREENKKEVINGLLLY